jgi:hypothetical protein
MNATRLLIIVAVLFLARSLPATEWYVATNGNDSGAGTINDPFATPQKAVTNPLLSIGDTNYIRGGTYYLSTQLKLTSLSGTASNYNKLWAYPGEKPVLDFSGTSSGTKAVYLTNSYWHVKGLEIAYAGDNGIVIMRGGNNIVEGCVVHDANNDGFRLGGSTGITSNNLILNCDSYRNFQVSSGGDNGDGFAAKNGVGPGNVFRYCRAWYNSDDGWDFYDNNSSALLDGCLTCSNGINIWGVSGFNGNGNGFKMGGASTSAHHILKNCVAFDILHDGFDQNHGRGGLTVYNCTAIRCGVNYNFADTPTNGVDRLTNNVSYSGSLIFNSTLVAVSNSWQNGITVSAADFQSLDPALALAPRNADYSLPNNAFARLAAGSGLIDKGLYVGQPYNGSAPDLGAYEYAAAPPPQNIWLSDLHGSETGFSFNVNGLTSHGPVIVHASDDLTGWSAQYTNPAVTGTLPYLDSSATNSPRRFYRVEEQ